MKRVTFSLFLLIIVFIMGGPVFAGDGDDASSISLRIAISPTQGDAGTVITVNGSGADPGMPVIVALAPQGNSAADALATVEVAPASDGSFTTNLTVPDSAADGQYAVRAEQFTVNGGVMHYYWNVFVVGSGGDGGPFLPETGVVPGTPLTVTALLALLLLVVMGARGLYAVWAKR